MSSSLQSASERPAVTTPEKHRDHAAALAKGIGIIGVVAHHVANRRFTEPERSWIALLGIVMDWAVPLFLCVSGYLHALARKRRPETTLGFITSRIRRLLLPFAIISLVYSIAYAVLIARGLLGDAPPNEATWFQRWIQMITTGNGGVGEQLYFLPLLFLVSAAAVIIIAVTNAKPLALGLIAAVFIGLPTLAPDALLALPGRPVVEWTTFTAGLGAYLAGFYLGSNSQASRRIFVLSALAGIAMILAGKFGGFHVVYAIVLLSGLIVTKITSRPLEWLGDASGTIFLYHTPFFLQPILAMIAKKAPLGSQVALAYGGLAVTILFFALVHHALVRTPFRRFTF